MLRIGVAITALLLASPVSAADTVRKVGSWTVRSYTDPMTDHQNVLASVEDGRRSFIVRCLDGDISAILVMRDSRERLPTPGSNIDLTFRVDGKVGFVRGSRFAQANIGIHPLEPLIDYLRAGIKAAGFELTTLDQAVIRLGFQTEGSADAMKAVDACQR